MQAGAVQLKLMADIVDLQAKMRQVEKMMGGTTAQFLEAQKAADAMNRSMAGINTSSLQQASKHIDQVGVSAKQTANAMRMIPMQMTDIAVGLGSGQSPFTVLLQQGGQLKDSFGGVMPALKGVGQYMLQLPGAVMGLVNPFTIAAASAAALGAAYYQGSKEADEFRKQLLLTGNAAGASVDQLAGYAAAMDQAFGVTTGKAAEALALMAATGKVTRTSLQDYAQVAIDMEKSFGISMLKTADHFAELGKDPVAASKRLDDSMNYLTAATLEQIKAADRLGNTQQAARIAQDAYAEAMKMRAAEMRQNLGYIESAWIGITGAAKEAWDAMLGVGRKKSIQEQIKEAEAALDQRRSRNESVGIKDGKATQELRDQIEAMKEMARLQQQAEDAKLQILNNQRAEKVANEKRDKEREEAMRKAKADAEAAAKAHQQLVTSGLKLYDDLMAKESGLAGDFTEKWDQLTAAYKAGRISLAGLTEAQALLLAQQPKMVKMREDEAKLIKMINDDTAKTIGTAWQQVDAIQQQIDQQAKANATFGQGKSALAELTLAEYEHQMSVLQGTDRVIPGYIEALQQRIDKQRELIEQIKKGELLDANAAAAKKAAEEWQRTWDQVAQSMTDALMNGGKSVKEYLKGLFRTLVLRPMLQPVVGGMMGMMGMANPAMAAGSGDAMGLAGSLFGAGGLAGSVMAGAGWMTGATTLGGSLGAAGALMGTGSMAGVMSGLGMAAGALGPIVLGLSAVVSLAKKLDTSGTIHTGGIAQYSADGGLQTSTQHGAFGAGFGGVNLGQGSMDMASGLAKGIVGLLDQTAVAFGKTAGYQAATAFADDTSKDGAWGALVISKAGQDMLNWNDSRTSRWAPKEFANGEQGVKEYLAAVGNDVRNMLMEQTPGWADAMLQALGDAPSIDKLAEVVQQINAIQASLTRLGQMMPQLSGLSDEATASLLQAFGGIEGLSGSVGAYYEAYYTEAERTAAATARLKDQITALGLTVPGSREAFRALIEAQDLSTESGRKMYAALMQLAPAFAELVPAATEAANAADSLSGATESMAASMARSAEDIARERDGLMRELWQLTGDTAAMRNAERNALDESNRALYDQIQAIKDQQAAAQEAARAAEAAAQAYQQAVSQAQQALQQAQSSLASAQNAVDAVRARGTSAYLQALERVNSLQAQVADAQRQALLEYLDIAKQLRGYVAGETAAPSAQFAQALTKAMAGDKEAMRSLTGLAGGAIDAARNSAATGAEFRLQQARLLAQVSAAAAEATRLAGGATEQSPQDKLQADLLKAQQDLATALATANAIGAPLVAQQESLLADYQKALAELANATASVSAAQAALNAISGNTAATAGSTAATHSEAIKIAQRLDALKDSIALDFKKLDITADGLLTLDELRAGLDGKASDAELLKIFRELDVNGDGTISQLEAIRQASQTSAATAGRVTFDRNDPLYSIWASIDGSTSWLIHIHGYLGHINNKLDWLTEIHGYLGHINNRLAGTLTVTSANQSGQASYFANGGAFANGIVSRPTAFNMGVMGEAGPEAIMPLTNVGGALGVRAEMPGMQGLQDELRALRAEVVMLRAEARSTAVSSAQTARILNRVTQDGDAITTSAAA